MNLAKLAKCLLKKIFSHTCLLHSRVVSHSFFQHGDSGVIFKQTTEYECKKCHKRWTE